MKINEVHSVLRFYLINILIIFTSVALKNSDRKQVFCFFGDGLPKASDQKLGAEMRKRKQVNGQIQCISPTFCLLLIKISSYLCPFNLSPH